MRTRRSCLVGLLTLGLLGGPGGTATAEEEPIEPVSIVYSEGTLSLDRLLDYGQESLTRGLVRQMRGLEATNLIEHADPRFSGTLHWDDISWDAYPGRMGPKWGHYTLDNDGGSWRGWMLGLEVQGEDGAIPVYVGMATGLGGYAGLSAVCHTTYPDGPGWDGEDQCSIFEGPLPDLSTPPVE